MQYARIFPEAFNNSKISSTIKMVESRITMLRTMFRNMACAGNDLTSSNLPAPKYCAIMADIALRVCPKIQINIDKKEPTIPVD